MEWSIIKIVLMFALLLMIPVILFFAFIGFIDFLQKIKSWKDNQKL